MNNLFDAHIAAGFDRRLGLFQSAGTMDAIIGKMDRFGIDRCLLRSGESQGSGFAESNQKLFAVAAQGGRRFAPAPIVVPNSAEETGEERDFVAKCIEHGAVSVWFCPKTHFVPILTNITGALFMALQERLLPLFIDHNEIDAAGIDHICTDYPELPVVLNGAGYRQGRWLYALLRAHSNLYITTVGWAYTNCGIEYVKDVAGIERILFATGYPRSDPAGSIAYLSYADISEDDRSCIGRTNMERLIECIR